jgi:hypothetical protein
MDSSIKTNYGLEEEKTSEIAWKPSNEDEKEIMNNFHEIISYDIYNKTKVPPIPPYYRIVEVQLQNWADKKYELMSRCANLRGYKMINLNEAAKIWKTEKDKIEHFIWIWKNQTMTSIYAPFYFVWKENKNITYGQFELEYLKALGDPEFYKACKK